jgi:hypothetical protein
MIYLVSAKCTVYNCIGMSKRLVLIVGSHIGIKKLQYKENVILML